MAPLSSGESVGAERMVCSLASLLMRLPRVERDLAVGSRAEVLTAAVYCYSGFVVSLLISSPCHIIFAIIC
jgi:hypothetical protein